MVDFYYGLGSTAAGTNLEKICKYECDQSGGCTVKYTGPARLEETIVGHFPIFKYVYLMQNVSRPPVYQRPLAGTAPTTFSGPASTATKCSSARTIQP